MRENSYSIGSAVLALIWVGLLLGVSFLATPVKFLAPSLSLPVALDVGRQTFMALSWLELFLAIVLTALGILSREYWPRYLALSIFVLVLVQFFWLLPILDQRVEIILRGGQPEPSRLHTIYIIIEGIKLALLGGIAVIGLRRRQPAAGQL